MKLMAARSAAAAAALALAAPLASAATFVELEPNDTLATAQWLLTFDPSIIVNGARTFADPSDDFFSFEVRAGGLLSITTFSANTAADSILGLYDPLGNLVASDDDGGPGSMSAITYAVPMGMTGTYTLGFSGYNPALLVCTATVTACYDTNGDFVFDTFVAGGGAGGSTGWGYTIEIGGVALVPEPGAAALLALGLPLLLALRRRRRPHD